MRRTLPHGVVSAGRLVAASLVSYRLPDATAPEPPPAFPVERTPGAPHVLDPSEFGLAGEIVAALDPWTEADPAALMLDLLVSFGSAVGRGPYTYGGGVRHEAKLNAVIVGDTAAGRKGTARAAINTLFEYVEPDWVRDHVGGGLSSGEGLVQAMSDLPEGKNFLAVETEFGRVLAVGARNGSIVSEMVRQLWDTDRVHILNRDATRLDGAFFSLIGHITEGELRAKMAEVDLINGFGNRVLWVYAQRSKLLPAGGRVPDEVLSPHAERLAGAILEARRLGQMNRTRKAEKRWEQWYLEQARIRHGGLVRAVTDRSEAQCARLQVAFAALDGADQIAVEHVKRAAAVWRYCEESAAFVFGQSVGDRRADKVLHALRRAEGRELKRSVIRRTVLSDNPSRDQLDAIRDLLRDGGKVEVRFTQGSGRPAEVWKATE